MNHITPTPDKGIDPDLVFKEVENMLYKLAWTYSELYGISFDDARSDVFFGFMRACNAYNPAKAKGKFSTWCHFWVRTDLMMWGAKRNKCPLQFDDHGEEVYGFAAPLRSECLDIIEDLSTDARDIIHLLLETPAELLDGPIPAKTLMARVKTYIVEKLGTERHHVEEAHLEIQAAFRSVWQERN